MNIGVVLAGGKGNRFGSDIPKQYLKVNDNEVISYSINAFKKSKTTTAIIVVANPEYVSHIIDTYKIPCIEGGNTRNITINNALEFIKNNYHDCDKIIFADSARPLLTPQYIDTVDALLDTFDGVITIAKITDSLGQKGIGFINRDNYYLIQTPEAFRLDALKDFKADSDATAIVQQVPSTNINYCDKLGYNFKITYPNDLKIAEVLLENI
ncbi:MAG: 2-C-methyl-D-erythritol 4-phosphate cytidylyltransferase [Clostridia bacterium]